MHVCYKTGLSMYVCILPGSIKLVTAYLVPVYYPPQKNKFWGGIVESGLRVRPSVRDDISQTTKHFVLKHYPSICYLCAMRSAKFQKIRIQNKWLYPRAVFRDLCIYSKSHMCTGSVAQIFNCFQICLLPLFLLFGQTLILWGILLRKRYTCYSYKYEWIMSDYIAVVV